MIREELIEVKNTLKQMDTHISNLLFGLDGNHPDYKLLMELQDEVRADHDRASVLITNLDTKQYRQAIAEMKLGLESLENAQGELKKVAASIEKASKVVNALAKLLDLVA